MGLPAEVQSTLAIVTIVGLISLTYVVFLIALAIETQRSIRLQRELRKVRRSLAACSCGVVNQDHRLVAGQTAAPVMPYQLTTKPQSKVASEFPKGIP